MGFSIGRFLGAVAGPIGALIGSPGLGAIVGAVGSGLSRPAPIPGRQLAAVAAPQVAAVSATSVVPTPAGGISQTFNLPGAGFAAAPSRGFGTSGFGVQRRRVGLTGMVASGVRGAFGLALAGGLVLSDILQRSRENTGQRVTKNKIIDAAKHCGIELAADTFGISDSDVCKVIVAGRTRRRRGISAADVRRTKRTLRFVRTIRADFKKVRL